MLVTFVVRSVNKRTGMTNHQPIKDVDEIAFLVRFYKRYFVKGKDVYGIDFDSEFVG